MILRVFSHQNASVMLHSPALLTQMTHSAHLTIQVLQQNMLETGNISHQHCSSVYLFTPLETCHGFWHASILTLWLTSNVHNRSGWTFSLVISTGSNNSLSWWILHDGACFIWASGGSWALILLLVLSGLGVLVSWGGVLGFAWGFFCLCFFGEGLGEEGERVQHKDITQL